jgi:glycerophosphoryl diester phosphodiesterase
MFPMDRLRMLLPGLGVMLTMTSVAPAQLITAHRGASHDAPENTLAAFRLAWEQDADAIEGDFRLTADGQIVCIHDADTARTCGVDLAVVSTPLDRLRGLDFGRWKAPAFAGETCPTLGEVCAVVPAGKRFFVELKTGPEIVAPLSRQFESLGIDRDAVVIIAFDERTVAACKERLPKVQAHWLTSFKETAKGSGVWTPSAAQVVETVRRCRADGVGMQGRRAVVDEAFVSRLRDGGVAAFHIWTVDSPDDARFFAGLGAMGITTNRPAFIRAALEPR